MTAIDHVVRRPTFDTFHFDMLHQTVRLLTSSGSPWLPHAEEHRSGEIGIRLSTSIGGSLSLVTLNEGMAEDLIEIPWDVTSTREVDDADAVVQSVAAYMHLFSERNDDAWLIDRWILGTAVLLSDEGHDAIMIRLPGPHFDMSALGRDMQPVRSPLLDRIATIAPKAMQAEMGGTDTGTAVWIQAASGLCDPGERHHPATDPVLSLRAASFVREQLEAVR